MRTSTMKGAGSVASGARLARSSVRPETPASVHKGWEVSKSKSSAKLRLSDLTALTKVLVRTSRSSPMGSSLACEFGSGRSQLGRPSRGRHRPRRVDRVRAGRER